MSLVKLLSDAIVLDGSPEDRARVRRLSAGEPVERPFGAWMGVTRCVSAAPDVRGLWERLLTWEARCGDGMLRGGPSTILEAQEAVVSKANTPALHVSLGQVRETAVARHYRVAGVPRFTCAVQPRKLRNISHWLLDYLPQVVALLNVAADATMLLPEPLSDVHRSSLSIVGLAPGQVVPWEGDPTRCDRLLIFESDGRRGGGRPLSPLLELRRLVAGTVAPSNGRRARRIYVSRRDARVKRRWVTNRTQRRVEKLFAARGFEILSPTDYRLDELVPIFRDAGVIAGLNGAGLAHILFSPPGAHVIVLFSDSLIRWYAAEGGSRSSWATGQEATNGELAAFGDSPRFYAHVAAAFEQMCHSFVSGDEVPLDELAAFLDDVLMRVDIA